ncbi:hypothetical protein GN956_G19946 [Arapaima gigas]
MQTTCSNRREGLTGEDLTEHSSEEGKRPECHQNDVEAAKAGQAALGATREPISTMSEVSLLFYSGRDAQLRSPWRSSSQLPVRTTDSNLLRFCPPLWGGGFPNLTDP